MDSFSTTTSQSWLSRLGDAFKGILVGLLMTVVSFPLLFWNEGRAVKTAKSLVEGERAVVSIGSEQIDVAHEGQLVHFSGRATSDETLRDEQFGLTARGLRLARNVEMYQWVETTSTESRTKLGGSEETVTTYDYDTEWSDQVIDSERFEHPEGHANPGRFPVPVCAVQAREVQVGAYRLPQELVGQIVGGECLPVDPESLPPAMADRVRAEGEGAYYWPADGSGPAAAPAVGDSVVGESVVGESVVGESVVGERATGSSAAPDGEGGVQLVLPDSPATTPAADPAAAPSEPRAETDTTPGPVRVGDARITFTLTPEQEVSVIARQTGDTLTPFPTDAGRQLSMLDQGVHTAAEMFAAAHASNRTMTWLLRGVGTLVMFLGFVMILRPLSVLADVVPLFGRIVGAGAGVVAALLAISLSLTTIGIAWVFYRPLLGISLLALAGVGGVLLFRWLRRQEPVEAEAI